MPPALTCILSLTLFFCTCCVTVQLPEENTQHNQPAESADHHRREYAETEAPPGTVVDSQSSETIPMQLRTVPLAVAVTPGKPQKVHLGDSTPLAFPSLDDTTSSETSGILGGALAKHKNSNPHRLDSVSVQAFADAGSPAVSSGGMNASMRTVTLTPAGAYATSIVLWVCSCSLHVRVRHLSGIPTQCSESFAHI